MGGIPLYGMLQQPKKKDPYAELRALQKDPYSELRNLSLSSGLQDTEEENPYSNLFSNLGLTLKEVAMSVTNPAYSTQLIEQEPPSEDRDKRLRVRRMFQNFPQAATSFENDLYDTLGKLALSAAAFSNPFAKEDRARVLGEAKEGISNAFKSGKDVAVAMKNDPMLVGKGLVNLPAILLSTPISAITGIDMLSDDANLLSPDEQARKIKETIGFIVGGASIKQIRNAWKIGAAEQSGMRSPEMLSGALGPDNLRKASQLTSEFRQGLDIAAGAGFSKAGLITERITRGLAEGSISGAAYGLVAGMNEDDAFEQVIHNGIIFAPLGAMLELVGAPKFIQNAGDSYKLATLINRWREFSYNESKTILDLVRDREFLIKNPDVMLEPSVIKDLANKKTVFSIGAYRGMKLEGDMIAGRHFTTSQKLAGIFAHDAGRSLFKRTTGENVVRESLEFKNPLYLKTPSDVGEAPEISLARLAGVKLPKHFDEMPRMTKVYNESLAKLKEMGYDGVLIENANINEKAKAFGYDKPGNFVEYIDLRPTMGLEEELLDKLWGNIKAELSKPTKASRIPDNFIFNTEFNRLFNKFLSKDPSLASKRDLYKYHIADRLYDLIDKKYMELDSPEAIERRGYVEVRNALSLLARQSSKLDERLEKKSPTLLEFNKLFGNQHQIEIKPDGVGRYMLQHSPSGAVVTTVNSVKEGADFINMLDDPKGGVALDEHGALIPSTNNTIPPNSPPLAPQFGGPTPWSNRWWDIAVARARNWHIGGFHVADMRSKMQVHDLATRGMVPMTKFMDELQASQFKEHAERKPFLDRSYEILGRIRKEGFTQAQVETVRQYIETISPGELTPYMSKEEIGAAQAIVAQDTLRQLPVLLTVSRLMKDGIDINELGALGAMIAGDQKLQSTLNILMSIRQQSTDELSLSRITRLVNAWGGDPNDVSKHSLSRADFIKKMGPGINPEMIKWGEDIARVFEELRTVFNIPDERLLQSYMTHAALYKTGTLKDFARQLTSIDGDVKGPHAFWAEMIRTGEMTEYEMNPALALIRYVRGGFSAKHFRPTMDKVMPEFRESIKRFLVAYPQFKDTGVIKDIQSSLEDFIASSRGWRDRLETEASGTIDALLESVPGFNKSDSNAVKQGFLRAFQSGTTAGFLGGRLRGALMDMFSSTATAVAWFGFDDARLMLTKGFELKRKGDELIKTGMLPGVTSERISDPFRPDIAGKVQGSFLNRTLRKTSDLLFKASGQQYVYDAVAQGAYYVGEVKVVDNGNMFKHKLITEDEFVKRTKLDVYDRTTKERIIQLVNEGNISLAGEVAGRAAQSLVMPIYGHGSQGRGWNTIYGRLFGQLGSYSSHAYGNILNMASRGSATEIAGRIARISAFQTAVGVVGMELGYDLSNWYYHKSMLTRLGGPIMDTASNSMRVVVGNKFDQEIAANELKRSMLPPFFVPGSYMARDIYKANDLSTMGRPVTQIVGRAMGIPIYRNQDPGMSELFTDLVFPWDWID